MQICNVCEGELHVSEFPNSKHSVLGVSKTCKNCLAMKQRERVAIKKPWDVNMITGFKPVYAVPTSMLQTYSVDRADGEV